GPAGERWKGHPRAVLRGTSFGLNTDRPLYGRSVLICLPGPSSCKVDQAPPPGVFKVMTVPASQSRLALPGNGAILPFGGNILFVPTAPGPPRPAPLGARFLRSDTIETCAGDKSSIERIAPLPPGCSPSPPDSDRMEYSRTRIG